MMAFVLGVSFEFFEGCGLTSGCGNGGVGVEIRV